ncbi:hypothetical protein AJ78_08896, partial [Emergomyces pasteurianus Ep9510]
MAIKNLLAATVAAFFLLVSSTFAGDLDSRTNVAIYYGQGWNQMRLSHFCQQSSSDIILLAFVHIFPDQGKGGYPGTNFGNQCPGTVYRNERGEVTDLLKNCRQITEDIPLCQAAGKKVLLSLGGATDSYKIESNRSARSFADFLWGAFGPKTTGWGNRPRPFDDVSVDGFDFDIEHNGDFGYATMVDRLRERFREDRTKKYYISAAPQCPPDDKQLAKPIMSSHFDFIFVQFYNTLYCSARSWITNPRTSAFSFDSWVQLVKRSPNPHAKVYLGLSAGVNATVDPIYYLTPEEVKRLAKNFMDKHPDNFGGIMLWEATYSENNQIGGMSYAYHMKKLLTGLVSPGPDPTASATTLYPTSSDPPYPSEDPLPTETPYP